MQSVEAYFETRASHLRLFYQSWNPHPHPKVTVMITHGMGEHTESYLPLIENLKDLPIEWIAWDQQGHGRSDGQRGYVRNFQEMLTDFAEFYQHVQKIKKTNRVVCFAHSMGGLVQLSALRQMNELTQAQILSSPFLGLALAVPKLKLLLADISHNLFPRITLWNEIRNEQLSRRPEMHEIYDKDLLRHQRISSPLFLGIRAEQERLLSQKFDFQGATLVLLSDKDPVVSSPVNLQFFSNMQGVSQRLVVFPGRAHELIHDIGFDEVFAEIRGFLKTL